MATFGRIASTSQQRLKLWPFSFLRRIMPICESVSEKSSSPSRWKGTPSKQSISKRLEPWRCSFGMLSYPISSKRWKEILRSFMEVLSQTLPTEIRPSLLIESPSHVQTMLSQKLGLEVIWVLKNSCISKPTPQGKPLIVL